MSSYHVYPEGDIFPHRLSPNCECKPKLKYNLWVHNSWDGREKIEKKMDKAIKNQTIIKS